MKYHIITFGCQMNHNDSERIASFLDKNGFLETNKDNADLIIVNACAVKKTAVDKIHGQIRNIYKKRQPTTILTGCVLDKERKSMENIFDYILDKKDLSQWPIPIKKAANYFDIPPKRKNSSAYITIMTGCNNFCSYCAVPYTKGRENSRNWQDIIKETEDAVKKGYKDIWLLGQNVNSYKGGISFAELLNKVNNISGDFWIRFTSSHPKDFSMDVIEQMARCEKVTEYFNLPIQSGDNHILQKMNRPYTVEQYKDIINCVRKKIPEVVISTDIIVGFPGEKEKNFRNTVKLFNEVNFEMAYISCYSPRPGTASYKMKDDISQKEKKRRAKILTEIMKEKTLIKNKQLKGKTVDVIVLGKNKNYLYGKTRGYKSVVFSGKDNLIGNFVKVKINKVSPWGLKAEKI